MSGRAVGAPSLASPVVEAVAAVTRGSGVEVRGQGTPVLQPLLALVPTLPASRLMVALGVCGTLEQCRRLPAVCREEAVAEVCREEAAAVTRHRQCP